MNDIDSVYSRPPVFKRIDGPWIGLLVLSIFIFVSSIIAIIVLCLLWRRHQKRSPFPTQTSILSNKPTGNRQIGDQQSKPFETQKMKIFVPSNEQERFHPSFPSPDDIQQVRQFYERTTKAYY